MAKYNVLFLCTANSARSIMAEAILRHWGASRFQAFSAGSQPRGEVHPLALKTLKQFQVNTDGLRSKSWDEFAAPAADPMHFVFTVCDRAAAEVCPVWPGQPLTAHWGIEDPAAKDGPPEHQQRAFARAFQELSARISIFTSLRIDALDRIALGSALDRIGDQVPDVKPAE